MDKFGFDEVTSSAGDVQQDAVGSLLTTGGMMDGTDSATARHEDEAKRNPNGTADVIDRKGFVGETVYLAEVCHPTQWKTLPTSELLDEGFPVYGANGIIGYYSEYNHENPVVAITCRGATCGTVNITMPKAYVTGNAMCLDDVRRDINIYYLFYAVKAMDYTNIISGSAQPQITRRGLSKAKIKVIDSKNQKVVVETLQKIEGLIGLRKQQLEQLDTLIKARFVELFGDLANPECKWDRERIVDICVKADDIKCGPFGTQLNKDEYQKTGVAVWEIPQINSIFTEFPTHFLTEEKAEQLNAYSLIPGDIAMSRKGNVGRCAVFPEDYEPGIIHSDVLRIRVNQKKVLPIFMMNQLHFSGAVQHQISLVSSGAIMAGINVTKLKEILVHIPPIEIQEQFADFVAQINKLKVEVQKSLDKMQILFDSLMQEYFG